MTRRPLATALCIASCLFGLVGCKLEQLKYLATGIETVRLSERSYMLKGAGGNIGVLVGDDGVLVVDTQYAPLTGKILAAIASVSDKPVRHVVNTHWHHDHTGGNQNFGRAGAVIVAHEKLRTRLMSTQVLKEWDLSFPPLPPDALPALTYSDTLALRAHGYEADLVHPPAAHTDGDSIVVFPTANVIHMGDIVATGRFPFIDRGAGGSVQGVIAAVERAIALADDNTKVIPGHGELATRADLVRYLDMLRQSRAAILPLMQAGKTRDQVIALKPLAGLAPAWGQDFVSADMFAGIVYDTESRR